MRYWICFCVFVFVRIVEYTVLERLGHKPLAIGMLMMWFPLWLSKQGGSAGNHCVAWLMFTGLLLLVWLDLTTAALLTVWSVPGLAAWVIATPRPDSHSHETQAD